MVRITVVGCTGKLGGTIMQNILKRKDVQNDVELNYISLFCMKSKELHSL